MIDYELCNHCLSTVALTDSILIFEDKDNSTVQYVGKCPLCECSVYSETYPLTRGEKT
jgi:hypothetical protein